MARKRGIPGDRLGRISEELSKASRGEFGAPSKYERALFPPSEPEPYPEEPAPVEQDEGRSLDDASIQDLCEMLGISYSHCFEEYSPVLSALNGTSTRVSTMKFEPDDDLRETLMQIVQSGAGEGHAGAVESGDWRKVRIGQEQVYSMIPGTIIVTWVNGKPAWEYWDITLKDYMDFRQAASPGKYLNSNLRSSSQGPIG